MMAFGKGFRAVNISTRVLNVAADLALCILLLRLCLSFTPSVPVRCIFAAALVLQPWTSQCIRDIQPDTLAALLTAAGIAALAVFVIARKSSAARNWLLTGSALLSATFLMRPEMIVFTPFLVCLAMLLRWAGWQSFLAYSAIAALPFFVSVALNVAYRLRAEGKPAVFGKFQYEWPGLLRWTGTFVGSEPVKTRGIVWCRTLGPMATPFDRLPARAFDNPSEKARVREVYERIRAQGRMTAADDAVFMAIANERIQRNPMRWYLGVHLCNVLGHWLDVTNLTELKGDVFQFLRSRGLSDKACVAAYLGLKVLILLFFLVDCLWLALRGRRCVDKKTLGLLLMGLAFVVARTVFFAFYNNHIEQRYMVTAWPFVLLMACHGFAQCLEWRRPIRTR